MSNSERQLTKSFRLGLGWRKDQPGPHGATWKDIEQLVGRPRIGNKKHVDLRRYFPDVRHQGSLYSSTAFACLAVVEYFEKRAYGSICERSKAFLYAMTRLTDMSKTIGRGFSIEATLKTLVRYGCPPEVYFPYVARNCTARPKERHLFGYSEDFRELRYVRLDFPDATGKDTLKITKKCIQCGIPVVFGVEIHHLTPTSGPVSKARKLFPLSLPFYAVGWQSVVACGYHDRKNCLLARNSWGTNWGSKKLGGYGWLPYKYVLQDHTAGFWILFKDEWLACIAEKKTAKSR
jgi:C1A family cysteine protease